VPLEQKARELGLRPYEATAVELEVALVRAVAPELLALCDEAVDLRPHRLDGVMVGIHDCGQGTPALQESVVRNVNFVRIVTGTGDRRRSANVQP
jgi:hypothetical protein